MRESSVQKQAEALIGKTLEGRYQIISVLGHGGMGVVYKAHHIFMDRGIALKMILDGGDDYDVARFLQEARSAAALKHPNIITVFECGLAENIYPYLIMDLLEGSSLAEILRVRGSIPYASAVPVFAKLCDGLLHAHKKKVIHRDLKPSNIMIVRDDENQPQPVLLDFGLAKILPTDSQPELQKLTQTGAIFGTPHYMSPEQCMGSQCDHRSDIYSMGCIMYEVLTGELAAKGDNFLQLLQYHIGGRPLPMDTLNPKGQIPLALQKVIFKAMEKEPENRQQDMGQLKQELLEALGPSRDVPRAPTNERVVESTAASPLSPSGFDPHAYRPPKRTHSKSDRQPDEEEMRLLQELESAEHQHGIATSDTLPYLETLASYYKDVELYSEAQEVYEKILALMTGVYGECSKAVAGIRSKLGFVCHMQEQFKDSAYHYTQAIDIQRQLNPTPNIDVAWELFLSHQSYKKFDEWGYAEKNLQEALDIVENYCLPDETPTFVDWCVDAGRFFYDVSKDEKAEVYYKKALEMGEKLWGDRHASMIDPYLSTGEHYDRINETQKAEPFFRKAINCAHKSLPPKDNKFAIVSYKTGKFYYWSGDYEKAKKCFHATYDVDLHNRGPESVEHIYTLQFLGMTYARLENYTESEKFLVRSIEITELNEGEFADNLVDTLIEYAWTQKSLKQIDKSEKTMMRAVAIARKNHGEENRGELVRPMRELGSLYIALKKYERAEFTLRDLVALIEEVHGPDSDKLVKPLYSLADALKYLGKTDAAMNFELRARSIETAGS